MSCITISIAEFPKNIPVNPESGKSRGKVVAHVTPDQQKEWLLDRSEELGFLLKTDQFDVVSTFWKKFKKSGQNQVTLKFATFEGILEIKDAEIFRKTLLQGIGRGKAYGCGLLTIVKV